MEYSPEQWREVLRTTVAEEAEAERIREATRTGRPLGEEGFVRIMEGRLRRRLTPGKTGAADAAYSGGRDFGGARLRKSGIEVSVPGLGEAGQAVERVHRFLAEDQIGHPFSHGGAVLVAVARSAAEQPHIGCFRVPVHDEILIRRVLVLAHARL